MGDSPKETSRRVLIASVNPLFGEGLRRLFRERWDEAAVVVGLTSSMAETLEALDQLHPDLVILDYDDQSINREEFLSHFVAGDWPMQVVLVSLKASGAVVVYDRRSFTSSEAEDWLSMTWLSRSGSRRPPSSKRRNMKKFTAMSKLAEFFCVCGRLWELARGGMLHG